MATKCFNVFEYYLALFPDLWPDVKRATREGNAMQRAGWTKLYVEVSEKWVMHSAIHQAAEKNDLEGMQQLLLD